MANNPGHSEIIETVVDVRMFEVVAEPDKKNSDAATTSSIVEEDVPEIPLLMRKMNEAEGFIFQRNVDKIESYCAMHWESRNVVHDRGSSGFYQVPQNMRQRQGWERLFDPTYINFSNVRDMLENEYPDDETRSLLDHYYYHFLVIRKINPKVKLEDYLLMIEKHWKEIARCYEVEEADSDLRLLLGLLLSSFFVVCLFFISFNSIVFIEDTEYFDRWLKVSWLDISGYRVDIEKDRECYHRWVNDLWVDLLVLENQIPFFVLKRVVDKVKGEDPDDTIEFCTHHYFRQFVPLNRYDKQLNGVHLLDIVHRSLLPDKQTVSWKFYKVRSRESPVMRVIPTATRLQEAGVQFRPVEREGFVVEFKKGVLRLPRGVLRLPRLHIKRNTEKFFINLIAWEQCHQPAVKYVVNFAILMDQLINTSKDVAILIQNNVLELSQVTEEEVAAMFNRLGEDLIPTKNEENNKEYDFLEELSYKLNQFCETRLDIWLANLMKVYFNSPWTILSLIGVLLLILLTLVQTFFSAFSYFRPPKSHEH
ncbi:UPF0481 protein At3g47200-like [Aristolochia californica]|uniref:UPF0481 protein At3g47200-like n=1 Tax=Aristolochia californica TaxID=171875 RepID=UPI0035E197D2